MAALPYEAIVSSPLFKFLVGPDRSEFTLHAAVVACQSPALDRLINGGLEESIERKVIWDHTDADTFVRFSQYVYTGTYNEAQPVKRRPEGADSSAFSAGIEQSLSGHKEPLSSDNPEGYDSNPHEASTSQSLPQDNLLSPQEARERLGHTTRRRPKKKNMCLDWEEPSPFKPDYERETPPPKKTAVIWQRMVNLYPAPGNGEDYRGNASDEVFAEVLLCHAKHYVLADYWGIGVLKRMGMALGRLRLALTGYTLHPGTHNDITALVQYSFGNTVSSEAERDALQSLICLYVACKVGDLWKDDEFRELSKEWPDFAEGLITVLLDRLED